MALIDNIVGYWKLDESSGNAIDTPGTNDGTVVGCDYSQTGKINTSLGFVRANSDHVLLGSDTTLRFTSAFSVQAWIKTSSAVGAGNVYSIFSMYQASAASGWAFGLNEDGYVQLYYLDSGVATDIKLGAIAVDDQAWHHVVGVWTGTNLQVYVDGSQDGGDVAASNTPVYKATHLPLIGSLHTYGAERVSNFNGFIDEVGVWGGGLSPSEVSSLYNSGNGLAYPFVVGWSDSSGDLAYQITYDSGRVNISANAYVQIFLESK